MEFQDITPEQLVIFCEALANSIARDLPFSLQYVSGNIFLLLGQIIITFNAQQQLHQDGYGLRYSPKNRDINNSNHKNNNNERTNKSIDALEQTVLSLQQQIDNIKQQMYFVTSKEE